jgi:hypothetical protein
MKIVPVIVAVLVCVVLYFVVLERDTLLEFAGRMADAGASQLPDATRSRPQPKTWLKKQP